MLARTRTLFAIESLSAAYGEARDLLELHWAEVAPYPDILTLNPNMELYLAAEARNALFVVTARYEGRLIGYIMMTLSQHPHYKHVRVATDDLHFIHRDYRRGGIGIQLFQAAEAESRRRGAAIMTLRTKVALDHSVLFRRLGYDPLDLTYSKRLDGG